MFPNFGIMDKGLLAYTEDSIEIHERKWKRERRKTESNNTRTGKSVAYGIQQYKDRNECCLPLGKFFRTQELVSEEPTLSVNTYLLSCLNMHLSMIFNLKLSCLHNLGLRYSKYYYIIWR